MHDWCQWLGLVEAVCGGIGSIALAYVNGREARTIGYSSIIMYERNWIATIIWFTSSIIIVAIIAVVLWAIAEVIEDQNKIIELCESQRNVNSSEKMEVLNSESSNKDVFSRFLDKNSQGNVDKQEELEE